jgi:acyl-CoA synthetase (AMP-forming)/AMP-acid ligase II
LGGKIEEAGVDPIEDVPGAHGGAFREETRPRASSVHEQPAGFLTRIENLLHLTPAAHGTTLGSPTAFACQQSRDLIQPRMADVCHEATLGETDMDASLAAFSFSSVSSRSEGRALRPASIAELLPRAALTNPRSGVRLIPAGRDSDSALVTYAALLDEARRILGGLQGHDHHCGGKVALLLERPGDFIPAFWACVLGGYVPCPVVPIRNDADRWAKHLAHVDNLLDHPLFVTTGALSSELPGVAGVDVDTLRAATPGEPTFEAQLADPAVLVLTSGSTGNCKAVVLTHANLLASMAAKAARQRLTASDVTLNWIAFDHVAALLEVHMVSLYVGAEQLHAEPATILTDPLQFLRLIDRYRVSVTFTPNFLLGQINAALQSPPPQSAGSHSAALDLSCVRHIVSGGEANVVETGRRFLELLAPSGLARNVLNPRSA